MKATVWMTATASASITVEISDEELRQLAADNETTVEDLTEADIKEFIAEKAYDQGVPGICAQCSGWGRDYSLDLDGEWEIDNIEKDIEIKR